MKTFSHIPGVARSAAVLERKEAGAEPKTPLEIKAALDKISDQVKQHGEKAIAEAEKGIKLSTENKEQIDVLLTKQGELSAQLTDSLARLEEVEQKAARRGAGPQEEKSIGRQFVEQEGFANFCKEKGKSKFSVGFKAVTTITSATSGTGAAGANVVRDRVVSPMMTPGQRQLTVRDLIMPGRTASNAIEYVQETGFQNMAAVQAAEGNAKAQSDIAFTLVNSSVATIAHWVKASKQILSDAPMLESYIDGRLRYGLEYAEELQLLMGSGSGGNLNGIYTQATAYSAPAGALVGSATIIDIIRLAMLQATLAEYPPDGTILNPTQWAAIELLKDSEGRYIIGNPQGTLQPTLWGRSVVATQAMTTDKFLVGSFGMGAQVFDREDAGVTVSTEDSDNFTKNLVTILAEERIALAVYRPEAFIKGDLGLVS